jgi:hypothetical protein
MARVKLPMRICEACHHPYDPDPLNAHHQKYCRRPGCLRRRKRIRQRVCYRKRYWEDEEFRKRERRRAGDRKRRRAEEAPPARPPEPDRRDLALIGMAAHLADSRDPDVVREVLDRCVGWGRDLAGAASARSPPSF